MGILASFLVLSRGEKPQYCQLSKLQLVKGKMMGTQHAEVHVLTSLGTLTNPSQLTWGAILPDERPMPTLFNDLPFA